MGILKRDIVGQLKSTSIIGTLVGDPKAINYNGKVVVQKSQYLTIPFKVV